MVGAAQQVEQRLVVVLAGGGERALARFQLVFEHHRVKTLLVQLPAGEFVDHPRVLEQVARGPFGCTQHAQQPLVHRRPLLQQSEVAFATQQRLDPVGHAQRGGFAHPAVFQPGAGALHQPGQAGAGVLAQRQHARVFAPVGHLGGKRRRQLRQHRLQIFHRGARLAVAALAVAAAVGRAEQRVELLGHGLAVGIERVQEGTGVGKAQGAGDPGQVVVAGGQDVGLLVVEVLDAVLHPPQKVVGPGQGGHRVGRHEPGALQPRQRRQRGACAQFGELAAAYHLQQLHGEFDLADAAA